MYGHVTVNSAHLAYFFVLENLVEAFCNIKKGASLSNTLIDFAGDTVRGERSMSLSSSKFKVNFLW